MAINRAVGGRKIAVFVCVHLGVGKPGFLGLAAFAVPWSGVRHCFANLGVSLGDWIGTRLINSVGCNSLLALSSSEQVVSGSPKRTSVVLLNRYERKKMSKSIRQVHTLILIVLLLVGGMVGRAAAVRKSAPVKEKQIALRAAIRDQICLKKVTIFGVFF